MYRVGQKMETWLAATNSLAETQKTKLQLMEKENLLWVSSWITEGKRRLKHAIKPLQKRQKCRHPLRCVSNSEEAPVSKTETSNVLQKVNVLNS